MRLCVLDCSFAMAWVFEDERTATADALLERLDGGDSVVMPAVLWSLEVRNALRSGVLRQRMTAAQAEARRLALQGLPRLEAPCPDGLGDTLNELMLRCDVTSYDAAYLALAQANALPLATLDDKLRRAANAIGVPLYQSS